MLRGHVRTCLYQRVRRLRLLRRVVPRVGHADLDNGGLVDRLHPECEAVDTGDHRGDGVGDDEADLVGLRHQAGRNPCRVARLPQVAVNGRDVVEMILRVRPDADELDVWMLLRLLRREGLIAEGRREDHLVALADEVFVDGNHVRALGDRSDRGRLHPELAFEILPRSIPLQGPARTVNRIDPDERNLELAAGSRCRAWAAGHERERHRQGQREEPGQSHALPPSAPGPQSGAGMRDSMHASVRV